MRKLLDYKSHQIKNINISGLGEMVAVVTGEDSWFEFDNDENTSCYLEVEMSFSPAKIGNTQFHHCKLYFLEEGMKYFDENHSITIPLDKVGQFSTYKFKCLPFQTTKIMKFRFDPSITKGELIIRKFQLVPYSSREKEPGEKTNVLLLSFFARSGSTLLMKMLTHHPEITGYDKGTHEGHIIRYFSRLYYMIKNSHLYTSDFSEGPFLDRMKIFSQHYRENSVLPKPVEFNQHMDLSIFREMYSEFISNYLPFLLEDVDAPNRKSPKFYIEKHMDGAHFGFTRSILELFPESKILMLFRDPRDVFLSFEAFSKKEKIIPLDGSDQEKIEHIMKHYQGRLLLYKEYSDRIVKINYENIVSGDVNIIKAMLQELNLSDSNECVNAMLESLKRNDLQASLHSTSGGAEQSVQRWRRELNVEQQKLFSYYDEQIELIGYERTLVTA